ncbi:MAG: hypothetical protein NC452_14585 [Eubacterium sp.]|nr:hypothetical protein [Eubacterium sp.]
MIKAIIQKTPYCTEMTFPCSETELSEWLGEIQMSPEHTCPFAIVNRIIEPAELSVLEENEVSLDALNYLGKRLDGGVRFLFRVENIYGFAFLFFTRFMPTNGFVQPFVGIISF